MNAWPNRRGRKHLLGHVAISQWDFSWEIEDVIITIKIRNETRTYMYTYTQARSELKCTHFSHLGILWKAALQVQGALDNVP